MIENKDCNDLFAYLVQNNPPPKKRTKQNQKQKQVTWNA